MYNSYVQIIRGEYKYMNKSIKYFKYANEYINCLNTFYDKYKNIIDECILNDEYDLMTNILDDLMYDNCDS